MKKLHIIVLLSILLLGSSHLFAQQIDGFVPSTTDRDPKQVSGVNVPPVFVYSSGDGLNSGTESPLATCTPETVTVKGPSGENITTTTICEKVYVASNPDKQFTVTGICSAISPSSMSATCTATNTTVNWTNVAMGVTPRLDNQPIANWPSIFCAGCTWQWVQSSNSCLSSVANSTGLQLNHNFAGTPSGSCQSVGVIRVSDPQTGKSWNSTTITARLTPTPIVRNHVLTAAVTVGANDEIYNTRSSQSTDSVASITFTPMLDGLTSGSWPNSPINCPACVYSHTVTSNTCSNVTLNSGSTTASHNVDTNGTCSFSLVMTVTDPETLWSARLPASGSYSVTLRKKPPTCLPATETQWQPRTDSCSSGFTGSITYEMQQSRNFVCATPYSVGSWTPWTDTGTTRNNVNGCLANCVPLSPETRWTNQSQTCPSGQLGTITWEAEERRTSYCPSVTGSPQWGSWAPTGSTRNNVNTCATACTPLPMESQWVASSAACPSGQVGSHTWERRQTRTSSCPSLTGSPAWSSWTDTGETRNVSNTCATTCSPLPAQTRWVSDGKSCPAGYTGTHTWESEEKRTSSCPSSTGSPTWSGWSKTGATRNVVNTCSPVPPDCFPKTEDKWVSRSAACPSGYTGSHSWELKQTRTYQCPAGTWTGWSDTTEKRNEVNTCAAPVVDPVDEFKAGCYVDTTAFDYVSEGSCSAGGANTRIAGQPPAIIFSTGDVTNADKFSRSAKASNVTITWSGACVGSSSSCAIYGSCAYYDQQGKTCPGLGSKRATATIRNTVTGKTRSLTVIATDNTSSPAAGGPSFSEP